jgi:hypothetical protein
MRVLKHKTTAKTEKTTHSFLEKEEMAALICFFEGSFTGSKNRFHLASSLDYYSKQSSQSKKNSTDDRQIKEKLLEAPASVLERADIIAAQSAAQTGPGLLEHNRQY